MEYSHEPVRGCPNTEYEFHVLSISCLDRPSPVLSPFIHYARKQYTDWMRLAQDSVKFWGTAIKLRTSDMGEFFAIRAVCQSLEGDCAVWGVMHTILVGESFYGFWNVNTHFWLGSFDEDSKLRGRSFRSDEEVQQAVHEWLFSQPKEFFSSMHFRDAGTFVWNAMETT
jgi:hypothetical protein